MAKVYCERKCESSKEGLCVLDTLSMMNEGGCNEFVERRVPQFAPVSVDDVVVYDDAGRPSMMVRFSRISNKELFGGTDRPHPAFVIDGKVYDEIYISKYPNTVIDGKAYSVPFAKPEVNITLEQAEKACFDKGEGWHLWTMAERGLIALHGLKKGVTPHGNTNYGKYHADEKETGIIYDGKKTLAGSGPITWSHDHTPYGVNDLCGNVWGWTRGLRLMDGEVQVAKDNDAAMNIDLSKSSKHWKPLMVGENSVRIDASDGAIGFTTEKADADYCGCEWCDVNFEFGITEEIRELALFDGEPNAYIYADTEGERLPLCGGYWNYGARNGVFAVSLANPRSNSSAGVGFRSAFYRKL